MNVVNLLEETKEILERHSKTFDDILFVGDEATHTKMTVKEFLNTLMLNIMVDMVSKKSIQS